MSSFSPLAVILDSARTEFLEVLHVDVRPRRGERELSALRESVDHKTRDFVTRLDQAFSRAEE
jgi:hypothetical protein